MKFYVRFLYLPCYPWNDIAKWELPKPDSVFRSIYNGLNFDFCPQGNPLLVRAILYMADFLLIYKKFLREICIHDTSDLDLGIQCTKFDSVVGFVPNFV